MTVVEWICGTVLWLAIFLCINDSINTYLRYKHEEKMFLLSKGECNNET